VERWWTFCESVIFTSEQCKNENKPRLHSEGTVSVRLISKEAATRQVKLTLDGGYEEKVVKLKAWGQAAVLDLGSRRDLSQRATLTVRVKPLKGRLIDAPPRRMSEDAALGACGLVPGGSKSDSIFSSCQCEGDAYVAGKNAACQTEKLRKEFDPRELTGKGCFCQRYSRTWPLTDLRAQGEVNVTVAGESLQLQFSPRVHQVQGMNRCRVVLSGDRMWLGSSQTIADIYQAQRDMITKAERSVYIENQYFGSRLSSQVEATTKRCRNLASKTSNDLAEILFQKITSKALKNQKFSAVVVFPLATEECETQYPNLRTAQCLQEALQEFWTKNNISMPLKDYFGMYNLANLVSVKTRTSASYFYGIFVHSKLMAIDYDTAGAEAIVGSANINDRSLIGDRDAEVSVHLKGPFAQVLLSSLLKYHADSSPPSPSHLLQPHLSEIAEANVDRLKEVGMDWNKGTLSENKFLDQNAKSLLNMSEAFEVGSGVHWQMLPGQSLQQPLSGHLFPWRLATWGDADVYRSWKHLHPSGAWMQIS